MGTLTGFVTKTANSVDFMNNFKKKFWLSHLGLWWTQTRAEDVRNFSSKKLFVHYEMDNLQYFNQDSSSINNQFLILL